LTTLPFTSDISEGFTEGSLLVVPHMHSSYPSSLTVPKLDDIAGPYAVKSELIAITCSQEALHEAVSIDQHENFEVLTLDLCQSEKLKFTC
jgi:hypothetical protein